MKFGVDTCVWRFMYAEAEVTPKVLRKIAIVTPKMAIVTPKMAIVTSEMAIVTPKSIVTPVYSGQNPEY